jgi:hypothetical protein
MDDELHLGMPRGSANYEDDGEQRDEHDIISAASWGRFPTTDLSRFDWDNSDIDGYDSEDGDNADADEQEEGQQADDGSTQNVED